jgi:proline dehydrogenase
MLLRNFIFWLSTQKAITERIARTGMRRGFARRFIAGERLADALNASRELNAGQRLVSLNHLGENVHTREEAEGVRDGYLEMIRAMEQENIEGNISIKLTQLGLDLGRDLCEQLTREILATAMTLRRTIEVDMEGSPYTDVTMDIFESLRRTYDNVAMAIQAYLYRTAGDLQRLAPLAPKIRLVKGAYREPAKIAYQKKSDVDANYCRLLDVLLSGSFTAAIATHDARMLEYAKEQIQARGLGPERYEFQMIYGIRRDLQEDLRAAGYPLRIYVPFGTEWCPYFMRRLSERPANCWFVLRSLLAESGKSQRS